MNDFIEWDAPKRFEVSFPEDNAISLYYDTFNEADMCARLNAGMVTDTFTMEVLTTYKENYN